jgi:hypothetical protein
MTRSKLSDKDHETLASWGRFELRHGHSPSLADVLRFGVDKSTASVSYRIDRLVELGRLARCEHCPREAARTVHIVTPAERKAAG